MSGQSFPLSYSRAQSSVFSEWGPLRAVLEVAILVTCIGCALMPILPAYGTQGALIAVVLGVIAGALPVVLSGFFRWPFLLMLVVAFAVYVVVGGAVAFGKELLWGVVPSGHSITRTLGGIVTSWKEALTLEPPLGGSQGVLVLPFLIAFLGAFVASAIATWRRSWTTTMLAGLVPCIVLVVAILWGTQSDLSGVQVGLIVPLILLVWATWRMKSWRVGRGVLMAGFVAVVVGVTTITAPLAQSNHPRFVLRSIVVPPFDPKDQISPLSMYRAYIKDYQDVDLLTVKGLPQDALVRLATMDEYDGVVWNVSGDGNKSGSGSFRRIGDRIEQTVSGTQYATSFVVEGLTGVWTPTVGYLNTVNFERGPRNLDFRFNDSTGSAVVIGGLVEGTTYRMSGVVPTVPTDEDLGEATVGNIAIASASNIPDVVADKAVSVSRDATTVPLVVRKFEEFLSTRGYFSHGESVDGFPSLSGHGSARMSDLLSADQMIGDAEQYASAMALMARSQGIPSRVVMGFIPEEDHNGDVTFTGGDMQAWVEIYYNDFGWVPYFPTPPSSQTPKQSEKEAQSEPEPEAIQQPPDPQPPVTPPALDTEDTDIAADDDDRAEWVDWGAIIKGIAAVGVPILIIVLIPVLIIGAKLRRSRRRKRALGAERVLGGWQELMDNALDLGIRPGKDLTRRETAKFIEAGNPEAVVLPLADKADHADFSVDVIDEAHGADYWNHVDDAVSNLHSSVSRSKRVKARLSLASLRKR
ncbi:transglutaminase-like domain-containing protein [Timonella sp. A28]|uniref:transglutaminase-like domain-containing protein n=1 Tax=Timonella sp. A28 TaxID=3442640 RepID=UPI003EC00BEE